MRQLLISVSYWLSVVVKLVYFDTDVYTPLAHQNIPQLLTFVSLMYAYLIVRVVMTINLRRSKLEMINVVFYF